MDLKLITNAVRIENLTKKFDDTFAIKEMSLNIAKGKITALTGEDAAGKTTLIRLITGLLKPSCGKIQTLGLDPFIQKSVLNSKIGYMPQKFGLYEDLTVIENLMLYADLKGINVKTQFSPLALRKDDNTLNKMLAFTRLTQFQNRLAGKLSGGMKQKLGLACALLGKPEFLILDEPSVGVDPVSRLDLMKMVKASMSANMTVLWSTSYLEEARSFDEAIVLHQGKVIFKGKPKEIGETTEKFEKKIIELMGGYKEKESLIAKNFKLKSSSCQYPVEAINLVKKYGDFYAVKNNSFKIRQGEIFGLLGPNGAGKSTSFKMMCSLSKPTSGTSKIMGIDVFKHPSKARLHLGYMPQKFSLYKNLSVTQNLNFFAGIYGIDLLERKNRVLEIVEIFGLENFKDKNAEDLPLGFKQRLSLACALIHNPSVLFLDEPTSGVDVITRKEFWNHITSLAKKGVSVLVTTHFMDEAKYCDRISLFYKGEAIAVGSPAELQQKASASNMEDAFIKLIQEKEKKL